MTTRYFTLFLLSILSVAAFAAEPLRQDTTINRDWKFKLGDQPGAEAPSWNDADWSSVNLPHSFDMPSFLSKDV
jgi:hypothetical protein